MDPDKRSQLGAHYTDREKIMLIVGPVVVDPLTREWKAAKQTVQATLEKAEKAKSASASTKAHNDAWSLCVAFLERLRSFRVLDPACGSGNFLYLALLALKDLEHRVNLDCEVMGFTRQFPAVGPEAVRGIEINTYAAELARVSVWIGEIQWMQRNGFNVSRNPILKPLDNIECRDAILNLDGTEAQWPEADVVIGNPPFLGSKEMLSRLPENYVRKFRNTYRHEVSATADLVMLWVIKAGVLLRERRILGFGFVTTNKIRNGSNRVATEKIMLTCRIANAWADMPWVIDGASVRVSIICCDNGLYLGPCSILNGQSTNNISGELTSQKALLPQQTIKLTQNLGKAFVGGQKDGPFDIPNEVAYKFLTCPINPNGRPNSDVVRPWCNGMDLARRSSSTWIIDFGNMSEDDAALYEAPYAHIEKYVKPHRMRNRDAHRRKYWWQHGRPASRAKEAIGNSDYIIATPLHLNIAGLLKFTDHSFRITQW
ncbi:type II restriction/modification system DNA methylase subunit YeeA [Skermanella aerolata]|uniref:DNA methyltransferase n=1 Tax=Skermanella aerolata TaxID=393310 RepID=UPI003D225EF1